MVIVDDHLALLVLADALMWAEAVGAALHFHVPFVVAGPNDGGQMAAKAAGTGIDYRVLTG